MMKVTVDIQGAKTTIEGDPHEIESVLHALRDLASAIIPLVESLKVFQKRIKP